MYLLIVTRTYRQTSISFDCPIQAARFAALLWNSEHYAHRQTLLSVEVQSV